MAESLLQNGSPVETRDAASEIRRDPETPRPRQDLPDWLARELFKLFV